MNLQELFIANLKKYRKLQKISQLELAEECESAQTYISELEMGKKSPSLFMVERIASALGIEAVHLFTNEPMPKSRKTLGHIQKQEIVDRIHSAMVKIIEDY
ncbi:MAG: helix-turn-helix transcriptional regulator [Treponema sp.]|jgi:transcriptional regulator with XRE-family HTH domain|nr:helix-turn-helix transcriptional regulator [Treponema sp.]